jgi:ribosomal protein S18 acetylase RimI-like enzyme
VIGFSNFGPTRYSEYPFKAEIYAIYLLKEFQGYGVGKALFQKSLQSLSGQGFESLLIWVSKDNPSVCFYKGMGGKLFTTKKEEIGGVYLDEEAYGRKSF